MLKGCKLLHVRSTNPISRLSRSLDPTDREAAATALADVPPAMRGPGTAYRAVELAWRAFFRPDDPARSEVLASRVRMRRRASLARVDGCETALAVTSALPQTGDSLPSVCDVRP